MLTERFTPSLLSRSLPLSLKPSPLCCVDRLSSPRHFVFPLHSFIFLMFSFFVMFAGKSRPAKSRHVHFMNGREYLKQPDESS